MNRPSNIRIIPAEFRQLPASRLFRMGWNTADIAFSKGVAESTVYNWIGTSREVEMVDETLKKTGLIK